MMRHVSEPCADLLGAGLPARVQLTRPIARIGASSGMTFRHNGIAWVHPDLDAGIMSWRVREGLATGELIELPETANLSAA